MNLLDMFRKSKKAMSAVSSSASLGSMWACAVKFAPWKKDWYGVVIVETDIIEAQARDGITRVESTAQNPFSRCDPISLRGQVGHFEYVSQLGYWIGFFETKKDAEDAYRTFAVGLIQQIKSASAILDLSDEIKQV
jgi:hypothetical protein